MSDFLSSDIREFFEKFGKDFRQGLDEALSRAASARRGASEATGPVDPGDLIAEDPPDLAFARFVRHPSVILVLGHRGSGKSALACRLQELTRDIAPAFAVGLPSKANRLLPEWYGLAEDPMEIPQDAIIYIPESYRLFHARSSQTSQGRAIGELVNLSRHRRHTLIFDVQNPAHLDRNIISEADVVLVKEPGPLSRGFERPQLRPVLDAARVAFAGVGPHRRKRAIWVHAPLEGVEGQFLENRLPSFWTSALSRVFGDVPPVRKGPSADPAQGKKKKSTTVAPRRGTKASPTVRRQKAKRLRAHGYSYTEVGKLLGVGKSQAFRLVNGR